MRYDYILPCAALCSNIVGGQVFRTDLLTPLPANLYGDDDQIASDHLPVFMVFANPFNVPFRLLAIGDDESDRFAEMGIAEQPSLQRRSFVESDRRGRRWPRNLVATGANYTFNTNAPDAVKFFRVYRAP